MIQSSANLPYVAVLLSTYNGTRYLQAQIDSILQQEKVRVQVIVRDDGSTDGTQKLLDTLSADERISWYQGENLRPAQSFWKLLTDAPEADYYSFADQDDVWLPEKLRVAVEAISNQGNSPALYFCQTQPVDDKLNHLPRFQISPNLTFGESLINHFVGGNTMVMNAALRDILIRHSPTYCPMHDVYIYSVALGIGAKVVFDSTPHIYYRQHDNNVIGQAEGSMVVWQRRWRRIRHREFVRYRMARDIAEGYSDYLTSEHREQLKLFIEGKKNLVARWKLWKSPDFVCARQYTQKLFHLSLLFNTY